MIGSIVGCTLPGTFHGWTLSWTGSRPRPAAAGCRTMPATAAGSSTRRRRRSSSTGVLSRPSSGNSRRRPDSRRAMTPIARDSTGWSGCRRGSPTSSSDSFGRTAAGCPAAVGGGHPRRLPETRSQGSRKYTGRPSGTRASEPWHRGRDRTPARRPLPVSPGPRAAAPHPGGTKRRKRRSRTGRVDRPLNRGGLVPYTVPIGRRPARGYRRARSHRA